MPRTTNIANTCNAEMLALEQSHPGAELYAVMVALSLPVKALAACVGISPATIYAYGECIDNVPRMPLEQQKNAERVLATIKRLESEGKLNLEGSPKQRADQLAALLAVEEAPE